MKANLLNLLRPFHGADVRRLSAVVLIAVALPRLPFWPGASTVYVLDFLPETVFGVLSMAVAIGLLATMGCCRTRVIGRVVAMLAFVLWVTLAAATTSVTSIMLNLAFAYAMLGEIWADHV